MIQITEEYRNKIFSWLNFKPTGAEQKAILECMARQILIAGGERGGKSKITAKLGVLHAPISELIWLVGEDYNQCRPEYFYMVEDLDKLGFLEDASSSKEGSLELRLRGTKEVRGCVAKTISAKEIEKLGREAPDLILGCEAAQMTFEAYLRLFGRTAEKRGRLILSGTFEGSLGWYPELFTQWQGAGEDDAKSFSLPTWSNTIIFPGGREDPEIKRLEGRTPHDIFMERYAGVPCKPSGLIMTEFSNTVHVGEYNFDPNFPVYLAVDPGYAGAHAVEVAQIKDDVVYLIDEVYLQGYVTEEIIDICRQKKWWGNVQGGAIDIAGRQHQAMAAPVEIWQNKAGVYLQSKHVEVEAGIDLLRSFLLVNPVTKHPKIFFNHTNKGIIAECGGGKSPIHDGGAWLRDVNTGKPIPKNDHGCKSVIYLLATKFGYTARSMNIKYEPIKSLTFNRR